MALFIDLLAAKHPCIFAPETSSFTAGRPCSERVRVWCSSLVVPSRVVALTCLQQLQAFTDRLIVLQSRAFGGNVEGLDSTSLYSSTRVAAPVSAAGCVGRGRHLLSLLQPCRNYCAADHLYQLPQSLRANICLSRTGNTMLRSNDTRMRQLKKDPRMDLQVVPFAVCWSFS